MKKIVAALDGLKFSESTTSYAIDIAKHSKAHLVGVFLDDVNHTSYDVYDLLNAQGGFLGNAKRKWDKKDEKARSIAVACFEKACIRSGLNYTIHRCRTNAARELVRESLYADLIVIARHETMSHSEQTVPTGFIRNLLAKAQCPLMLVPPVFKPTERIVILLDGDAASLQALKLFSYTLPELTRLPAEVVFVTDSDQRQSFPDDKFSIYMIYTFNLIIFDC